MSMRSKFSNYAVHFRRCAPVFTSSQSTQEHHAEVVSSWLELTTKLQDSRKLKQRNVMELLNFAMLGAQYLFEKGDDISAWLGQLRIAETADTLFPGIVAADHFGAAARYSTFLFFHDIADECLEKMRQHFKETDHPIAAKYWAFKGLNLRLNRRWMEAIPYFQLSLEHVEKSNPSEIIQYFGVHQEDLIANRLNFIADCWVNMAWLTDSNERHAYINNALKFLSKIAELRCQPLEFALTSLNNIELNLLLGKFEESEKGLIDLLENTTVKSPKAATMRPAAYCMYARLSDLKGDQTGMISHLSRALAESNLFPNVLQELLVVDFSLELMRAHALDIKNTAPLFEAMVLMLEAKDWYTGHGHSKSVAHYAQKLWASWQAHDEDQSIYEDLFWAAYLHDIGKLRLPRSLLNKIAPLSDKEWDLIRLHPGYGQKILESFKAGRISKWVSEHHQNSKGTGYPGNEPASPMGLCIAIADILEAATSIDRKYKQPKTLRQVIQEIRSMPGNPYPPGLIKALCSLDR